MEHHARAWQAQQILVLSFPSTYCCFRDVLVDARVSDSLRAGTVTQIGVTSWPLNWSPLFAEVGDQQQTHWRNESSLTDYWLTSWSTDFYYLLLNASPILLKACKILRGCPAVEPNGRSGSIQLAIKTISCLGRIFSRCTSGPEVTHGFYWEVGNYGNGTKMASFQCVMKTEPRAAAERNQTWPSNSGFLHNQNVTAYERRAQRVTIAQYLNLIRMPIVGSL